MNLLGMFGRGNLDEAEKDQPNVTFGFEEHAVRDSDSDASISDSEDGQESAGERQNTVQSTEATHPSSFVEDPNLLAGGDDVGPCLDGPASNPEAMVGFDVDTFSSHQASPAESGGGVDSGVISPAQTRPRSACRVSQEEPLSATHTVTAKGKPEESQIEKLSDLVGGLQVGNPPLPAQPALSISDLPVPTTYADATNLAALYPDLSEHFLETSISGATQAAPQEKADKDNASVPTQAENEQGARIEEHTAEVPHTPDHPNWAAAPLESRTEETKVRKARTSDNRSRGRSTPNNRGRHAGRKRPGPPFPHKTSESQDSPRPLHSNQHRGRRGSRVVVQNRIFNQYTRSASITAVPRDQQTPPQRNPSPAQRAPPPRFEAHSPSRVPHRIQSAQSSFHTVSSGRLLSPSGGVGGNGGPSLHSRLARQLSQQMTDDAAASETYQPNLNQQNDLQSDRNVWIQYLNSVAHLYYPQVGHVNRPPPAGADFPHTPIAPHLRPTVAPQVPSSLRTTPTHFPSVQTRYPNSALRQQRSPPNEFSEETAGSPSTFSIRNRGLGVDDDLSTEDGGRDPNGLLSFMQSRLATGAGRTQDLDSGSSSFNWRRATVAPQTTRQRSPMSSQQRFGTGNRTNDITSISGMYQETFMASQARGRLDHSKGITPRSQGPRAISRTQRQS